MPVSRTTNLNCLARTTTLQGIQVPGSEEGDNRKVSKIQINNYRQKGMEGLALVACHSSCNPNRIFSLSFVCGRGFDHWQSLTIIDNGDKRDYLGMKYVSNDTDTKSIQDHQNLLFGSGQWRILTIWRRKTKTKHKPETEHWTASPVVTSIKRISYLRTASLCCSLTVQPNLFIYKGSANTTYICSSNQ